MGARMPSLRISARTQVLAVNSEADDQAKYASERVR